MARVEKHWDTPSAPATGDEELRVLAVDILAPDSLSQGRANALTLVQFNEISPESLARWQPDLVLSPLVGNGFDCFDLAEVLARAGFRGRYRAAVDTLPDPAVVRREIAAQFPGLDFDLLMIAERVSAD
jgi:hypothetical protein